MIVVHQPRIAVVHGVISRVAVMMSQLLLPSTSCSLIYLCVLNKFVCYLLFITVLLQDLRDC
jgi:hypothetical protein